MLNVGAVSYINALPMFLAFRVRAIEARDFTVHYGVPSKLNNGLRRGGLDASLISTYEYLENRDRYTLLPKFCIAGRKKVMSVNLYTRVPVDQLSNKRIGLTSESSSSVNLVKVLCSHFWKVTPKYDVITHAVKPGQLDAFVLIGNRALEVQNIPGFQTVDLAEEWHKETGLPFVFAVLAARNEIAEAQSDELHSYCNLLSEALNWSKDHQDHLLTESMKRCPLPDSMLAEYFQCLNYKLGRKEKESIKLFEKLITSEKLITIS